MRFVAFLFLIFATQASATDSVRNQVGEIELDHEQKFSEHVENYLLSKDTEGVAVPRVLVKQHSIEIRDERGNQIRSISRVDDPTKKIRTNIYKGEHGKVVALHITRGQDPRRESWESGEYFILDKNGKETLHIKNFDDDTRPIPSPSGDYAVGWLGCDTPGGPPIFYDANGYRNKWAKGFSGDGWPEQYGAQKARFSPDGSRVAIIASKHGCFGPDPEMIVYDAQGGKLWEKIGATDALFSPSGARIIYWGPSELSAADANGHVLWSTATSSIPAAVSIDEKRLIVRSGQSISMLNMENGQLVWSWTAPWNNLKVPDSAGPNWKMVERKQPDFLIVNVAVSRDFSAIVIAASTLEWKFQQPGKPQGRAGSATNSLIVIDSKGHESARHVMPGDTFGVPEPELSISDDGRQIAVQGATGLLHFKIHSQEARH